MANINLMSDKKPTKVKRRAAAGPEDSQLPIILFAACVIVTLAVLLFVWLHLGNMIKDLDHRIDEAETERRRLEAIINQVNEFKKQKQLLERKIDVIDELKRKQSGPVQMLDDNSAAVPDYLWLTSLKEVGSELQIRGQATNIIAVTNFVGSMERSAWFSKVDPRQTQKVTKPPGYKFYVTANFHQPKKKKPAPEETPEEETPATEGAASGS